MQNTSSKGLNHLKSLWLIKGHSIDRHGGEWQDPYLQDAPNLYSPAGRWIAVPHLKWTYLRTKSSFDCPQPLHAWHGLVHRPTFLCLTSEPAEAFASNAHPILPTRPAYGIHPLHRKESWFSKVSLLSYGCCIAATYLRHLPTLAFPLLSRFWKRTAEMHKYFLRWSHVLQANGKWSSISWCSHMENPDWQRQFRLTTWYDAGS